MSRVAVRSCSDTTVAIAQGGQYAATHDLAGTLSGT
jgi:hypothetical protein